MWLMKQETIMVKTIGRWGLVPVILLALSSSASGQDYPNKPIRMVVAYPARGVVDFVARQISQNNDWLDGTTGGRGKSCRRERVDCDRSDGKIPAR